MHAVDLRSLQNANVLEIGSLAHDGFDHVAQHRVVGFDLLLARPSGNQFGLLVESRVRDMRDVSEPPERGTDISLVSQIDRQEIYAAAAEELRLAARDANHVPSCGKEFLDGGTSQ